MKTSTLKRASALKVTFLLFVSALVALTPCAQAHNKPNHSHSQAAFTMVAVIHLTTGLFFGKKALKNFQDAVPTKPNTPTTPTQQNMNAALSYLFFAPLSALLLISSAFLGLPPEHQK